MTTTDTETDDTQKILAEMLTENTGRHMLDSGGAYGRNWEHNQSGVESNGTAVEFFEHQPEATWDWGPTINVYHFLKARLDYAPKFDRAWRLFVLIGPGGASYYGDDSRYFNGLDTADQFLDQLGDKRPRNKRNDAGEELASDTYLDLEQEFSRMGWVNTYNGEDALSQVIQYKIFAVSDDCPFADQGAGYYVLLSIHGGCDVRGGYTDLRVFWLGDFDDVGSLFDNARVEMWCDKDPQQFNWMSDNAGYDWYFNGSTAAGFQPVPAADDGKPPRCPICGGELSVGMTPAG